jgi:cytochrome c oxidase subunit II
MYKKIILSLIFSSIAFWFMSCGESQQFVKIPNDINLDTVPKDTIEVIAKDFEFIPEIINVKQGTLVILKIKSIEGTHGFDLGAFGINISLEEGIVNTVEFYAEKSGEYGFHCSHFCGLGHFGMTGKLVVN